MGKHVTFITNMWWDNQKEHKNSIYSLLEICVRFATVRVKYGDSYTSLNYDISLPFSLLWCVLYCIKLSRAFTRSNWQTHMCSCKFGLELHFMHSTLQVCLNSNIQYSEIGVTMGWDTSPNWHCDVICLYTHICFVCYGILVYIPLFIQSVVNPGWWITCVLW